MRQTVLLIGLVAIAGMTLCGSAIGAANKVRVCHLPPADPENFHTITVSERALEAHLAHGDLVGSCFEHCEILCDDDNACTIDACDAETETCSYEHPPVDCDDSNLCTLDSCDSLSGCQYAPIVCDDDNACTGDICFEGECLYPNIDCGPEELCDPESGCYDPCAGVICDPIDQCHDAGVCAFPGNCIPGFPLPDGAPCSDGDEGTVNDQCLDGTCTGSIPIECPCFIEPDVDLEAYFLENADLQCRWQTDDRVDLRDLNYAQQSDYQLGAGLLTDGSGFCEAHNSAQGVNKGLHPITVEEALVCRDAIEQLAVSLGETCYYPPF